VEHSFTAGNAFKGQNNMYEICKEIGKDLK